MYVKKEFKRTSVYHMAIGTLVILYTFRRVTVLDSAHLLDAIPTLLASVLFIYYGFKSIKADRKAVIALLILNALQVVSLMVSSFYYQFSFGSFVQLDLMDWDIHSGFAANIWLSFNANSYTNDLAILRISLIPLAFVIYYLDQLRFIPKQREQPWEREFTDDSSLKK